jgi:hypothetical protein
MGVNPFQRPVDVLLEVVEEGEIAGPGGVKADEDQEEGRGIDGSVIAAEGELIQSGEFPDSDFMQDLPRLFIPPVVDEPCPDRWPGRAPYVPRVVHPRPAFGSR